MKQKKRYQPRTEDPAVTRRVIAVRRLHAESQADLSRQLGTTAQNWNNFEKGFPLSLDVAKLLHRQLGLSLDWLYFGETGSMPKKLLKRLED